MDVQVLVFHGFNSYSVTGRGRKWNSIQIASDSEWSVSTSWRKLHYRLNLPIIALPACLYMLTYIDSNILGRGFFSKWKYCNATLEWINQFITESALTCDKKDWLHQQVICVGKNICVHVATPVWEARSSTVSHWDISNIIHFFLVIKCYLQLISYTSHMLAVGSGEILFPQYFLSKVSTSRTNHICHFVWHPRVCVQLWSTKIKDTHTH